MTNPIVFLLGCPRSGTTLLRRMVDAHPDIAIVPEIRWLAQCFTQRDGLTPEGLITPGFLRSLTSFGRFSPLPIGPEEIAALACSGLSMHYSAFLTLLFDRYCEKKGKRLAGHKNADHAVAMDIATLHQLWPEAKFVHLIRDGRDVCLSVLNWRVRDRMARLFSTWKSDPVATIALWWEWQVRLGREAGLPLGPGTYLEVRYDAMVANPEATCARICDLTGLPWREEMVRFHERPTKPAAGLNPKQAWLPPTPGLRDWRSQMPVGDIVRFEAIAGDLLEELGYERVGRTTGMAGPRNVREAFELRPLPRVWG